MAEQVIKNSGNSNGSTGGARPQPPKSVKQQGQEMASEMSEQAGDAGRDFKERIVGLAEASADAARARAEEFVETAKDFAAEAGESIKQRAYEQKEAGADYIGNIADAMRRAAREFDDDLPFAGVYMRKAAAKIEDISDTVHHGDLSDLLHGVQDFARRQPTAFLGLAVLAGFGAVRFLKSSGDSRRTVDAEAAGNQSYRSADSRNEGNRNEGSRNEASRNEGYRDDFTK